MELIDPSKLANLSTNIATFKNRLLEGVMAGLEDGGEFRDLYMDLYQDIFVDFGKIGTVALKMLGINMRHMIDVVRSMKGDVDVFVRSLVEKQGAYVENQFVVNFLIEHI